MKKHVDETEEEPIDIDEERIATDHLDGVEEGSGCAEIWEHLSDEREQ